ncbi:MAG: glycosyltransferase [Patescibacteria group bacterium]|nr:glycosyltransferase [Patescibacteria group bacterium]
MIFLRNRLKENFEEGFNFRGTNFMTYNNLSFRESAFFNFSLWQKIVLITLMTVILLGIVFRLQLFLVISIALLTFLYFANLIFDFFLIFSSFWKNSELFITNNEIRYLDEDLLPVYTVFCPLYKEWEVIKQFISAISQLDYPKDKLQALLLLEENDKRTIEEARRITLPEYFQIVIVPDSLPKTKPKALNFGLKMAKGKLSVIYDAEDIPDKDQLKKAYLAFQKVDKKTICIQAKLNYYNPRQNLLTKLFTAEYCLWFDLILPGLQSIEAPIPLGGTSNHFLVSELKKLQGWDPFNVTEDCDLGIRLAKYGYKTKIINSTTFEEANSKPLNWYRQRSRWIKGYIQTYFVHMRDLKKFFNHNKKSNFFIFQLVVGGKVLSIFINPLMWLLTLSYFLFRPTLGKFIEPLFPPFVLYLGVICLVIGNFLYLFYYMIGCAKRNYFDLVKYVFFIPFYWLGMSISGWKSLYEIIAKPHYWAKTVHGFHLNKANETVEKKIAITEVIVES